MNLDIFSNFVFPTFISNAKGKGDKGKGKGGKGEGATSAVRGFCFVTFNKPEVAHRALGMNQQEIDGRSVFVRTAEQHKQEQSKGGKGKGKGDSLPAPRRPDQQRRDRSRSPRRR